MRRWPGVYRSLSYALVLALMLGGGILFTAHMPGKSWSSVLPPLTMEQARLADRLRKHIVVLSEEIGERNLWRDGTLNATADYIEETLQAIGYAVTSQAYTVQATSVRNLEAVLSGTSLAGEPRIPLPKGCQGYVKTCVLHAVALAHYAHHVCARSRPCQA